MAQSMSVVMTAPFADGGQDNKITCTWVSGTGGDAGNVSQGICSNFNSGQPQYQHGPRPSKIRGYLVRAVTNPGAAAPTANYDITLLDVHGVDVANSELLNRHTSTSEEVVFALPPLIDSEITVTIANAGDTKGGVLELHIEGSK